MSPQPTAQPIPDPHRVTLRAPVVAMAAGAISQLLNRRVWGRTRLLTDLLMLSLASSAAVLAAPELATAPDRLLAALFPLVATLLMHARRASDDRLHASILDSASAVIGAVSSSAVLTLAAASAVGASHPVGLTLRLWLFSVVYAGVARTALVSIRTQTMMNPALAVPTLILGAGSVGERLAKRLADDPGYGMRPVGFLDADPMPRPADSRVSAPVPILGGATDLAAVVDQTKARQVILAFSSEPDHALVDRIRECQQLGVAVALIPRLFESINGRATLDHVGGLPLLSLRPTDPHGWEFAVKHAFDRITALIALILAAPLMAVIALGVRLTSPGGAFFRQRRVGRDGRVFDLLKFRTMHEPTDAVRFELPDGCAPGGIEGEDRRTRFGRWLRDSSLDELPQLINVVRGDMSLVGPRPERPEYVERFAAEVVRYEDRHRVKSGITGWAQVHGLRGQTSIDDRVEWDNYYIRNWSLGLDVRILAMTLADMVHLGARHELRAPRAH